MSKSNIASESVVSKLRETEALSFLENGPENILSVLRERKFYNIAAEEVQIWRGKESLPPSHPAPSNQGSKLTCSSHALGKAVTEIFNGHHYECDQDDIIKQLEQNVQPEGHPQFLEKFIEKTAIVKFWRKGLESSSKSVEVRLIVQSEDVNRSWTGPKLKKEDLRKYNTSLVACGLVGTKREPHALYVDSCLPIMHPSDKNCHQFSCINSWGEKKNPYPKLNSVSDVYQIHYVSLFTVSQLVIASSGESSLNGDVFGIYDQVINDHVVLFRQRHSKNVDGKANLLYKTKDGFAIGQMGSQPCLENQVKDSLFYITTQTGEKCYVPLHKWKFFGKYD